MIRSKDGSSGIVSGLGSLFSKNNILDLNKGVCYYLKDNLCSRDFVTTSSSNFLNDFWPGYDSFVINLLKKKGYILLGKTILDEFSCGGTGLLANNGVLYHPTNPNHIIGGSSSGSALVVKKGFVSFSLASDTGGSIRIPAAYCGLLGFKPGYGFVSRQGLIPYCSFLDTVGILSSDLETLRKISTILGEEADSGDLWTVLTKKKKINNVVTTPPKKK